MCIMNPVCALYINLNVPISYFIFSPSSMFIEMQLRHAHIIQEVHCEGCCIKD